MAMLAPRPSAIALYVTSSLHGSHLVLVKRLRSMASNRLLDVEMLDEELGNSSL